ncbi:MAG TPA: hypothetical protein PK639_02950 [Candidatus Woesebacteria bacterium]|nr:hypothetical protein [Candidatus Woesebacteria bacterium]
MIFWLLVLFFGFHKPVLAEEMVKLSPAITEVIIEEKDNQKEIEYWLENYSEDDLSYKLKLVDFEGLNETVGVAFIGLSKNQVERKYGLASWMSVSSDQIVVPAKSKTKFKVLISNKESLSPGGHYAGVILESNQQNEKDLGFKQVFSSLILLKKRGGEIVSWKLKDLNFKNNYWEIPSEVLINFQNSGNVHVVPRGKIEITDSFGRVVANGLINRESGFVLPETIKTVKTEIVRNKKIVMIGKMKMVINYRIEDEESWQKIEKNWWYVDGKILLFLFLIPIVLLIIKPKKH